MNNATTFQTGQTVRIAAAFLDSPAEAAERFVVTEVNGDRVVIEWICDWQLKPTQTVLVSMIQPATSVQS
jgi:hypothetical protein